MPDLPQRVTLPLLTLITQQSLDEDYQVAAERRRLGTPSPRGPGSRRVAAVVIAVFGVLMSTAFVQTTLSEDTENAGRNALIERINAQRDRVDGLQEDIADLREENADLAELLTAHSEDAQAAESRLRRLQVITGFVAVRGPGAVLTVDNAPDADPLREVVRDEDLAILVDGLWAAGAEAISINGQRLTAMSSIRNSGVPIEVNGVGIAPPYTVRAIGDNRTLLARYVNSSAGLLFDSLVRDLGFSFDMDNDDDLSLPAAPQRYLRLRSATAGTSAAQSPKEEETGP
jgi:uncharacterized protein YlxW (UPF0749 family)